VVRLLSWISFWRCSIPQHRPPWPFPTPRFPIFRIPFQHVFRDAFFSTFKIVLPISGLFFLLVFLLKRFLACGFPLPLTSFLAHFFIVFSFFFLRIRGGLKTSGGPMQGATRLSWGWPSPYEYHFPSLPPFANFRLFPPHLSTILALDFPSPFPVLWLFFLPLFLSPPYLAFPQHRIHFPTYFVILLTICWLPCRSALSHTGRFLFSPLRSL